MVEVIREVGRDAFPSFVWSLLGDGRERFLKGRRGRSEPHHRYLTGIVLDDNFVANVHIIRQHGETTCHFRGQHVDHTVSYALIIPIAGPGGKVSRCGSNARACLAAFLLHRKPRPRPSPPAAVHRDNVFIAHLLKIVSDQRGAIPAAAIKQNLRLPVRKLLFDVTFDDPAGKVDCSGDVSGGPLVVLADVHKMEFLFCLQPFLQLWDCGLADAFFRVINERQKRRGMFFCHLIVLRGFSACFH